MRIIYCCLLLLLYCSYAAAQPRKFYARQITLPESFRDKYIGDVEKDGNGFIWFTTNNGLHRFDGNEVLTFDLNSRPALPGISLKKLLADKKHHIWTLNKEKLVCFDMDRWKISYLQATYPTTKTEVNPILTSITEGRDGTIYTGTANGNIYKVSGERLEKLITIDDKSGSYQTINSIDEPVAGELWITNNDGKIIKIQKTGSAFQVTGTYTLPQFRQKAIRQFYFHPSGNCLFICQDLGPFLLDSHTGTIRPFAPRQIRVPGKPGPEDFFSYGDDMIGFIPVKTASARTVSKLPLYVYDLKTGDVADYSFIYPQRLQQAALWTTHKTNTGTLVVTNQGITDIDEAQSPFETYLYNEEGSSIRFIYKPDDGRLRISSYSAQFIELNQLTGVTQNLQPKTFYCYLPCHDSMLLGENQQLFWYNVRSNALTGLSVKGKQPDKLLPLVSCMGRENDTLVWVGTYNGAYLINPFINEHASFTIIDKPLLPGLRIFDILSLGDKRYFATSAGLFVYNVNNGNLRNLFESSREEYRAIGFSSLQWIDNSIWAGTYGKGLLVVDSAGGIRNSYVTGNGLAGNVVYAIRQLQNYIVAGTGNGLSVIRRFDRFIRNYSTLDLLPSDEFNHNASFVKKDTAYFGTVTGLVAFTINDLNHYLSNPNAVQLHITKVSVGEKARTNTDYTLAYQPTPSVAIPSGADYFSVHFGGTDAILSGMRFYYRLNATDQWIAIGQQKEITFIGTPPGNYTLELMGELADGRKFNRLLVLPVTIAPAYYQTLWFMLLLIVLAVTLIIWAFKIRERQIKKEQQLRTKIAGDLHDEVGSSLTRIHFQADLLYNQFDGVNDAGKTESLLRIAESSRQALSSMNDMIWSIDSKFDTTTELVQRMRQFVSRIQDDFGIDCKMQVSGNEETRTLSQINRQNLFLIFKEAVNNASKYAAPPGIIITLHFGRLITLRVENVYEPQHTAKNALPGGGKGLHYMQKRATMMGADLQVLQKNNKFIILLYL